MSQSQNPTLSIRTLFNNAHAEGVLSPTSLQTLTAVDLGAQIQAGLGVSLDDVTASEVVLVTMMIDDSGSIRFSGNAKTVREATNGVIDTLAATAQASSILAHTCYLNGTVLYPYLPLVVADAGGHQRAATATSPRLRYRANPAIVRLDEKNYDPNLGTPLYDQTVILLGRVLAKQQEFAQGGVIARTVTLLVTDGADECSCRARIDDVRTLVEDLRGERHIVAALGIDNGSTDFRTIFRGMGIPDDWILVAGSNATDIRRAFQLFSQSAVRVSQGALNVTPGSLGSFLDA